VKFTRAIVRPPGRNFASGLTCAADGPPQFDAALQQHRRYCEALRACGLELTHLDADPLYPDGTFVEDAAIVTARGAILTRPGAPTRAGETDSVGRALRSFYPDMLKIDVPGTVDGGDVCEADGHFVIGVSARTNERGADLLKGHLESMGYSTTVIDIRGSTTLLHLKTGIAYLGDGIWVVAAALERDLEALGGLGIRDPITVAPPESYAANCVRVNESVLVPAGYPGITQALKERGLRPLPLDMSEFKKMDGGLSCLSLRFG
jgi:dimethylargininase